MALQANNFFKRIVREELKCGCLKEIKLGGEIEKTNNEGRAKLLDHKYTNNCKHFMYFL